MHGRLIASLGILSFFGLSVGACGDAGSESSDDGSSNRAVDGETVYSEPMASGNTFACVTCHALTEAASDGITRPGHPLQGAPQRASFKNGNADSFLDAANVCLTEWMGADTWTEDSPEYIALRDFLHEGEYSEEISFTIADLPNDAELVSGDPERGRDTFNETCIVCHGEDGAGTQKAPPIVGFDIDPELIAQRVRTSGTQQSLAYEGLTGGRMPFWSEERLSDEDLLDMVAFVSMWTPPETPDDSGDSGGSGGSGNSGSGGSNSSGSGGADGSGSGGTDGSGSGGSDASGGSGSGVGAAAPPANLGALRECGATHPKVGQVADLQAFSHDVAGRVRVVDDCTLEFENFGFDGRGIDVQFYGGLNGSFTFSMSGNLLRSEGYEGANFRMPIPEGTTLDDFDAISVWCVPVGVSFGDGQFE